MARVTNQDLAQRLDQLHERLTSIELEARLAKWVLRTIGLLFGSIVTLIITHWKGTK